MFIYECKDNQEYKEVVVGASEVPLLGAKLKASSLWGAIDKQELMEPLEKCVDREGFDYAYCPYKDRCLSIHRWEEVAE